MFPRRRRPVWKSKFHGAFVLNRRAVLHAIDATPARWLGDADSSPLDGTSAATPSPRHDLVKNCRVHPTHWLISTQAPTRKMSPAPSLTPTAPAALEPTGATALAPTAADGVSVDYNVSVPSISEAEAVEAVVETTTPEDVDEAVEVAATEVEAETGETSTIVESIATEEVSAVEIAADPPGTPGDDDPPTLLSLIHI